MSVTNRAPIRVFLIDSHQIVLWGLQRLIESGGPAIQVVGTARNCTEALRALDKAAPDLILLGLDLGLENGVAEMPKLIAKSQAKILVLTGVRDQSMQDKSVLAGASGVVEKEAPVDTILTAIARVHEGQIWLDRMATGRIFVELSRESNAQGENPERLKILSLTKKERAIIEVSARNVGATAKAIAGILFISEHTLRNHLTSIYHKLGVANRLELYSFANVHGLTKPSPPGDQANKGRASTRP